MKPSNFPGRKVMRRRSAYARLIARGPHPDGRGEVARLIEERSLRGSPGFNNPEEQRNVRTKKKRTSRGQR